MSVIIGQQTKKRNALVDEGIGLQHRLGEYYARAEIVGPKALAIKETRNAAKDEYLKMKAKHKQEVDEMIRRHEIAFQKLNIKYLRMEANIVGIE